MRCCSVISKHDSTAFPVSQLAHVEFPCFGKAMALIVAFDAFQSNEPGRSASIVGPGETMAEQQCAEPAALQGWKDREGGQVPGRASARRIQHLGLDNGAGSLESATRALVQVWDGEEDVADGVEGPDDRS